MSDYWEDRTAWDMYNHMKDADETADLIAKIYRNASMQITFAAEDIFERYMTKHKISEREAWELINTMQDRDSIQELILKLKNKDPDKTRQELIRELEAPAYRFRIERLKKLLEQIDAIMDNVYQQEQQFDTSVFQNLAEDAYYRKIYNIQRQTGLGFEFGHVDQKQIDQVLKMNWSGSHYSTRIWRNTGKLAETLKQEILVSLLTGRTEKDTAAVITNRCGSGAMQARRLVRTESCFVAGELDARAYEECGVSHYRFLAVLDLRTSEICQSLDNKVFSLSERQVGKNYPPMHPWCRSTTLSSASEEDLKNMKRRAYNPETGKTVLIPATMSYADWHRKYVEGDSKAETQKKMIKNVSADKKQFAQYQKVLGKDAPKRFADFQAMKYNEPENWNNLKLNYQDVQLQQKIRFEDYPKQIEEGKQGKHIPGHNNYTEGRSYLTMDSKEIQELANKYAGTGKLQRDGQGHWNHKEIVNMGKTIGVYKDLAGKELPTTIATIHYSKKGIHVVPAKPKEK